MAKKYIRNCTCDATHDRSFSLGLTNIDKVRKSIDYIPNDIFFFLIPITLLYWSFDRVQKYDTIRIFPGYGNFPGYGRLGMKTCRNSCRNPDYENVPGYGIFPGYGNFIRYGNYPEYGNYPGYWN